MKLHLISYDLRAEGKDYSSLTSSIRSYPAWAKISESCWAVRTSESAKTIRDKLVQFIDSNDVLFVCSFDDWASRGLSSEVTGWLHS